MRTAAFKALQHEEQLQCLAAWNGLSIKQQLAPGNIIWQGMQQQQQQQPQHSAGHAPATGSSETASNSSCTSSGPCLLVAAEPCVVAAVSATQLSRAAAALEQMHQQALQRQAQLHLFRAAAAAAAEATAAAGNAGGSPAAASARPVAAAAAASEAGVSCTAGLASLSMAAASTGWAEEGGSLISMPANAALQDEGTADEGTLADMPEASSAACLPEEGSSVHAQSQQQQQEACEELQQCQCCCHHKHAQQRPAPLVQPMSAALLEQFSEQPATGHTESSSGSSSSNTAGQVSTAGGTDSHLQLQQQPQQPQQEQLRQRRDRDMAAAFNSQLALGSGPLHGGLLSADGVVPKLQLHSCSGSSSVQAAGASAAGESPATQLAVQQAQGAVVGANSLAATAAASSDAESAVPAKVREGWLRSGLYDPFGKLQAQLPQLQQAPVQRQAVVPARLGMPSTSGAVGSRSSCTTSQEQSRTLSASSGAATYVSLGAASNQRQRGGFVMPGRRQIKQQVLQEEHQHQQHCLQQKQQVKQPKDRVLRCSTTAGGLGSLSCCTEAATCASPPECSSTASKQHRPRHSNCNRAGRSGSTDSESDDDGGLRQLPAGAADTVGKRRFGMTGGSSSGSHQQWSVPAYSSESGYIGGLYDEDTGTMYIN
uniref:Uncharacterized protein n=1 Tax=Tetradesmus obliquus TaxID=3088 RepID=A0A383VXY2_TETOB|eukprot:jgi/Sobl393_1/4756/SZX70328.1